MLNQKRVIIENVLPQLDGGTFFIKRVLEEKVIVSADVFADGHDVVVCCLKYKHEKEKNWSEVRMTHKGNDVWEAFFKVEKQGFYKYYIEGWIDYVLNWQQGISRKIDDRQKVTSELLEGVLYIEEILEKVSSAEKKYLKNVVRWFTDAAAYDKAITEATSKQLTAIFEAYPKKCLANQSHETKVYVDRKKARFSTWYEFFPRSASSEPNTHGTFKDCEKLLPRIAAMGFDTLYFPPIHPIGEINRKGKNNAVTAAQGDAGSPWGIGSKQGGHKSIHPELGTLEDFKSLVNEAKTLGIEIAMDFALQCAPDHPYIKEHPQWFKWRPDGTVQYAENPPKKYQDILPVYFETEDWQNLWEELLSIALFWIEACGIHIFRVDNPHTKPFYFWGWLLHEVKKKHPDVLFLSEAFTRPKVMYELAKQGFTQSYTYFTWRNSKKELIDYVEELTKTHQKEFFRPNFWPNTPDINPYPLQGANETTHLQKYFLAATLSSNTGIYGPVFEYMQSAAIPGKEEYADSEKYQIRRWDWEKENKITAIIAKINHARKAQPSLQQTNNIIFCDTDNEMLLAYYKYDDDKTNETLMVINLDAYYTKQGWVKVPLHHLGVREGQQIQLIDLITGSSYIWDKEWCFVELHPTLPFHLFKINT
jgi:starch synthase (maltosyl-transferring)